MRWHGQALIVFAFFLASGVIPTFAQQNPGSLTAQHPSQERMQQHDMMRLKAMGQRKMDDGMPGRGDMMNSPPMIRIIFILMDSNGDGSISLSEFQAAHERIFKAMDSNKDGELTFDEMQAFMHGSKGSMP